MQNEVRQLLAEAAENNSYLSIAIRESDTPIRGGFIPWVKTGTVFNMRTPDITLSVYDLEDGSIMADLKKCHLVGIYIFTALQDYSFLEGFREVQNLFILHGENISDLSFVYHMPELFMIYLEDASLPDLVPVIERFNKTKRLAGKCIGLRNCKVEDTSALAQMRFYTSEFLIWPSQGDSEERWKVDYSNVDTFRYYSKP